MKDFVLKESACFFYSNYSNGLFFSFYFSAALRKIKFLLKANVAKRVRLIFARVAHAIVTQNWLFVSMACKITLVTVNRASRGTENIVKVWPFLIDTAQLGPKPIWNFIKNFIYLCFAQRKNWVFLKFLGKLKNHNYNRTTDRLWPRCAVVFHNEYKYIFFFLWCDTKTILFSDINECEQLGDHNGHFCTQSNSICVNTFGSYKCK